MFTRGDSIEDHAYEATHLAPWNMPGSVVPRGQTGTYPGYGPHPIAGGYTEMRLDRGPMGEVAPGFGYALDPSDPATWRGRTQVFT